MNCSFCNNEMIEHLSQNNPYYECDKCECDPYLIEFRYYYDKDADENGGRNGFHFYVLHNNSKYLIMTDDQKIIIAKSVGGMGAYIGALELQFCSKTNPITPMNCKKKLETYLTFS